MPNEDFPVGQEQLSHVAQTMLECKRMGRSIQSSAEALLPLTDSENTIKELEYIRDRGTEAANAAANIYNRIARKALGS